jgi:protein-disulfide isomerase
MEKTNENSKNAFDWLTPSLAVLACLIVAITVYRIFASRAKSPKHRYIQGWRQFVKDPSHAMASKPTVQLVEFYSYTCGYCKILHHNLQQLKEEYPYKVSITYKPILNQDYYDAIAAECAGLQHEFKEYSNLLFEGKTDYKQVALESRVPRINNFTKCIKEKETKDIVVKNQAIADSLGLRGVPFLIIDGQLYIGALSTNSLTKIVKNKLKKF